MKPPTANLLVAIGLSAVTGCAPCPTGEQCMVPPAPCTKCPSDTLPSWSDWKSGMPAGSPPPASSLPQYGEGTVGLTSNGSSTGEVWSWPAEEGYLLDDLPSYTHDYPLRVQETVNSTAPAVTDFDAKVDSTSKCGPTDTSCGARGAYGYVTPEPAASGFPASVPASASVQIAQIKSFKKVNCPSGSFGSPTDVGWLYRTRDVVGGQVQWVEIWFLLGTRQAPDKCPGPGGVAIEEEHTLHIGTAPGPRQFVEQLQATSANKASVCPNAEPWCEYCTTHNCKYVRVDFDWLDRK